MKNYSLSYNPKSIRLIFKRELGDKIKYLEHLHRKALWYRDKEERINELLVCSDLTGELLMKCDSSNPHYEALDSLFKEIMKDYRKQES